MSLTQSNSSKSFFVLLVSTLFLVGPSSRAHGQAAKPKITLDEFFNSVSFPDVKVSPDGNSIVIETDRADWDEQTFRKELWLYRTAAADGRDQSAGKLIQLTQSGRNSSPQWSPDGRWIAFLSERKSGSAKDEDAGDKGKDAARSSQMGIAMYRWRGRRSKAHSIRQGVVGRTLADRVGAQR